MIIDLSEYSDAELQKHLQNVKNSKQRKLLEIARHDQVIEVLTKEILSRRELSTTNLPEK